jgi:hypothetical protein
MDSPVLLAGSKAWLHKGGRYSECPIYARGTELFAKFGAGFVKLRGSRETSVSKLYWTELDGGEDHEILNNGLHAPTFTALPSRPAKANVDAAPKLRRGKFS